MVVREGRGCSNACPTAKLTLSFDTDPPHYFTVITHSQVLSNKSSSAPPLPHICSSRATNPIYQESISSHSQPGPKKRAELRKSRLLAEAEVDAQQKRVASYATERMFDFRGQSSLDETDVSFGSSRDEVDEGDREEASAFKHRFDTRYKDRPLLATPEPSFPIDSPVKSMKLPPGSHRTLQQLLSQSLQFDPLAYKHSAFRQSYLGKDDISGDSVRSIGSSSGLVCRSTRRLGETKKEIGVSLWRRCRFR